MLPIDDMRLPTLPRTVVPAHWVGDQAAWYLLQARKFRYPIHINRGEFKAANAILEAGCGGGLPPGTRLVDLGDSRVTCGAWVKGRSPSWALNLEARRRSALEAAYDVAMVIPWTPTSFQPADVGTRPDAHGRLAVPGPIFLCAKLFLEVFGGSCRLTSAARG